MTLKDLHDGYLMQQMEAEVKADRPSTVVLHPLVYAKQTEDLRNEFGDTWLSAAYLGGAQ